MHALELDNIEPFRLLVPYWLGKQLTGLEIISHKNIIIQKRYPVFPSIYNEKLRKWFYKPHYKLMRAVCRKSKTICLQKLK